MGRGLLANLIEIPSDASILDAVQILSRNNILAAPVRNAEVASDTYWKGRYLGIIDYSAVVLWVLENAELAAFALSAGSATAAALGAGAVGGLGAIAIGATGPVAIAGLTLAASGAALAGGIAAEKSVGRDAATAADHLGEQFYRLLRQEEPFKSTTVKSVVEMYRWAPFLPVAVDSPMLTVLLLLSKYRLRNVPVIDLDKFHIKNFITQSAVVRGLKQCKGRDWFDCIAAHPLSDLGLPFMSYDEVITIQSDELILEAFKRMKDKRIGGLPVVEDSNRKIIGSVSIQDIRFLLLNPELFRNFRELTVMNFIKAIETASPSSGTQLLTCALDTCLGSVIDSLASRSVPRIYVVNGDEEVVGVVTLRDVISCFIYEPPGYFEEYFSSAIKDMVA
ncbi:SNF1-related protein kinase regulatory subunit gamma-1-like [Phalaenopsis equestris]|uniref:SNF1-related protein kinase regulatory subunit gamma-1-like n=1 Tax=Phalaenopsis equestris TaxID=78828 RepID=UPI0009E4FA1A|nr:SNF1-related protein kinase regulatory subunit gamma-1-like [Phalaenopsis equestris]